MTGNAPNRIADLAGRRILITGGSTGIGAAVSRAFAAQGAQVALHFNQSRDAAEQIQAEAPDNITLVQGDVSATGAAAAIVVEAADKLGGLDGLINNAGSMLGRIPTTQATAEHVTKVFDLNAKSVWEATVAAHPYLQASKDAFVINTSSIAGRNGGAGGAGVYAAAKSYVSSLTRGQAKEFAADGIRVNAVSPGLIQTPFHDRDTPKDMMSLQVKTIPMARAGVPEDCTGTFLFLASPSLSGYITGQIIEVNGGQLMP